MRNNGKDQIIKGIWSLKKKKPRREKVICRVIRKKSKKIETDRKKEMRIDRKKMKNEEDGEKKRRV